MSRESILLVGRETVEFPAHAVTARAEHLLGAGFDARLVCDEQRERWAALFDPDRRSSVRFGGPVPGVAHDRVWRLWDLRRRPRARRLGEGSRISTSVGLALTEGPDLVHFPTGRTAIEGAEAAARAGARIVVTLSAEDLLADGLGDPDHYEPLWRQVAAIHLTDESLWPRAIERGCPEDLPHTVIRPAAHPAFLAPGPEADGRGAGPLRLLSVGPLDWTQGYEHAIHAVRLLLDGGADCEYRIVGTGDYDAAVAFARHQLELEDRVELIAPLPPDGLREQLEWADVFLCPAVVAGTPAALLEAQAMGLPAVVSDAGRDPAAVDGSAMVFARRDPGALAEALGALAADASLRAAWWLPPAARQRKRTTSTRGSRPSNRSIGPFSKRR